MTMKQLILDGYNVINKIPELARALDKNLQAAREAPAIKVQPAPAASLMPVV